MVAAEGYFPKADNDPWYASEVNSMILNVNFSSIIGNAELIASATSQTLAATGSDVYYVKNTGENNTFINFGATATTNNFYLQPGEEIRLSLSSDNIQVVTASSTSSISILSGAAPCQTFNDVLTTKVSVTTASTTLSTTSFQTAIIINDGLYPAWLGIGAVATATKYRLGVGEKIELDRYDATGIGYITAITNTTANTTLRMIGLQKT